MRWNLGVATSALLLSMVLAPATNPVAAQSSCSWPMQEENGCCACIFGPGYWNCSPTCSGYCVVFGECVITRHELRFSPDGSMSPSVVDRALLAQRSLAEDVSSAATLSMSGVWDGLLFRQVKDCRGFVVARHYSEDAIADVRARSSSILI